MGAGGLEKKLFRCRLKVLSGYMGRGGSPWGREPADRIETS